MKINNNQIDWSHFVRGIYKTLQISRDNAININEFTAICKALFRNEKGKPYK